MEEKFDITDLQSGILEASLSMKFSYDLRLAAESILKELRQLILVDVCSVYLKKGALDTICYRLYPLPVNWEKLSTNEARTIFDSYSDRKTHNVGG